MKPVVRKAQSVLDQLTLPTERTVPSDNLSDYSMLLYGFEKIGKTSLAAQFPDAYFMLFEAGGKALPLYRTIINKWVEAVRIIDLLEKTDRFRTVIVDTGDIAYDLCLDFVCKKLAIDHPSDEEWGKGWGAVKKEFKLQMSRLVNNKQGRGIIFTSHAIEREIKQRGGGARHRVVPTMGGGARSVLEPMVDIWAHAYYRPDGSRWLRLRGNEEVAAGHRIEQHFVGVEELSMGASAKEAYANYVKAFNQRSAPAAPQKGGSTPVRKVVVRK